jgi:DNA-directed RNA polymerase specialized sigma24 family protein
LFVFFYSGNFRAKFKDPIIFIFVTSQVVVVLSGEKRHGVGDMKLENFVDSLGRPVPKEIRDELTEAVVQTISHPDSDVPAVVKRAQTIARRAVDGEIRDVLRYATKALFAVSRKQQRLSRQDLVSLQPPDIMTVLAGSAVDGSPAAIEARVLLTQLLDELTKTERDVFIRYTMGWKHGRIARELGISAAMSSYYLLRAKAGLDRFLNEKPVTAKREAQQDG